MIDKALKETLDQLLNDWHHWSKKTAVIEAFKWTGDHDQTEDPIWIVEAIRANTVRFGPPPNVVMMIDSPDGKRTAIVSKGDFVIRDELGEISSCEPDVFEANYQRVGDNIATGWRSRLEYEFMELNEKRVKLAAFMQNNPIFKGLPEAEKSLLVTQANYMGLYSSVLAERIDLQKK